MISGPKHSNVRQGVSDYQTMTPRKALKRWHKPEIARLSVLETMTGDKPFNKEAGRHYPVTS